VGMCTIDALKMLDYLKPPHRKGDEDRRKVLTFAALLAKQLLDNKWDCESEDASNATPRQMLPPPPRLSGNEEVWPRPQSAPARSHTHIGGTRCALVKIEDEYCRRDGDKRKPCHVCWKLHQKNRKSSWSCGSCRRSVCGPETGRGCFDTHAGMASRETVSESIPETGAEAPRATRRAREMM
jgi:hypothetical protein